MKYAPALAGLVGLAAWGQGLPAVGGVSGTTLATRDSDTVGGIVGRVCRDLNGDGQCSEEEPGLVGVRVLLETGQQALTDAHGRYHLAAVEARAPSLYRVAHLEPGRHRLAIDTRGLPPTARCVHPSVTVEVPMSGLVLQDFPIQDVDGGEGGVLRAAPEELPPSGRLEANLAVRFTATGRARPGDRVEVAGVAAQSDATGGFRAQVPLAPGSNVLAIVARSAAGEVRFFSQRVDVVRRGKGVLVVPREIRPTATVRIPAGEGHPAATGPSSLVVQAPAGSRLHYAGGELTVPSEGSVPVPVTLAAGRNTVSLALDAPGTATQTLQVIVDAEPRALVVGLLDLEGGVHYGGGISTGFTLYGRGAAHAELPLGSWRLVGELDLRDSDLADLQALKNASGATPASELANFTLGLRRPDRLDRALDPVLYPSQWGDDSAGAVPNPGEARLRAELSHPELGKLGLGTTRASIADGEVGRYQRTLFGPYVDLGTSLGPARVQLNGFAAPGWVDPVAQAASLPAHDELKATGGSVYYLSHGALLEGSEGVRVELRDALSGTPLAERHLVRGRDYEVSYLTGRILLAQPLSMLGGLSVLGTSALTELPEQVLVVEYEHASPALSGAVGGGELKGTWDSSWLPSPATVSVGGVDQSSAAGNPYQLVRARASVPIWRMNLSGEYAHSSGSALAADDFAASDDGGLSFLRPVAPVVGAGYAWSVRLKGGGFGDTGQQGFFDASYRARSADFSDEAHAGAVAFHDASLRTQQYVLGRLYVGLLADDLQGPDPREPFGLVPISSRVFGGSLGWRADRWEARLEGRDSWLSASIDPEDPTAAPQSGGRTSAGLFGRYRLTDWLAVLATYNQVLAQRGAGPGHYDNTFVSGGVEVSPSADQTVGVRGGWGPSLGPQVWLDGRMRDGAETHYGSYSVDVDGPDVGQHRMVSGAATRLGDRSSVFVEDVGAQDATSVRMSRAIGISDELLDGLEVTGRYERGVRDPLDTPSPLTRDTAGASATFARKRFRLFGRGEYRFERGTTFFGPPMPVSRTQWLASAAATVELLETLHFSGRFDASQTTNLGALEARFIDANAGLAWRSGPYALVLHYGALRNLPPPDPTRPQQGEYLAQVLSLQPAIHLGERFALAAGANASVLSVAGTQWLVLSASLRPSVRVVGGLEVAVEVARRSSAPDGGQLGAVRAEAGYRLADQFLLALGGTVVGYFGLDDNPTPYQPNRVYVRAELAY